MLLEDVAAGKHWQPENPDGDAVLVLVRERQPQLVDYAGWQVLDKLELERGEAIGRPRLKFTSVEAMLEALEESRQQNAVGE
jgi:ferredoxin--NADP+ reductase